MSTQTIVIECNRRQAVQQTEQAECESDIKLYDVKTLNTDNIPNNKWTNHLEFGIDINIGDMIKVESASLNARSASDSVMEFTGKSDYLYPDNGTPIDDSRAGFNFGYYINNRFQFNFNLPKSTHRVEYNMYSNSYGGPRLYDEGTGGATDFQNFQAFETCYPFRACEGYSHNNANPKAYNEIDVSLFPCFSKGSYKFTTPTPDRLYIGKEIWTGPYYMDDTDAVDGWDFFTSSVRLEVPKGFSTPSTISSVLTDQLHSRDGIASKWTTNNVVPKVFTYFPTGEYLEEESVAVTDKTYQTFPTSTGQLLYNHVSGPSYENWWPAKFMYEDGETEPGSGYDVLSGNANFYSYLMCGNPFQYKAMTKFMRVCQTSPGVGNDFSQNLAQEFLNLYTGEVAISSQTFNNLEFLIGEWGNQPSIFSLGLSHVETNVDYTNEAGASQNNVDASVLNTTSGTIYATNIVFNETTINMLSECYEIYSEIAYSTTQINRDDQNFLTSNVVPWIIGRLNDEQTLCQAGRNRYMSNILMEYERQNGGLPAGWVGTNAGNSYDDFVHHDPANAGGNITTSSIYGLLSEPLTDNNPVIKGERYQVKCAKFLEKRYTPENAIISNLPYGNGSLYPQNVNSEWQSFPPNKDFASLQANYELIRNKFTGLGIGLVPIYQTTLGIQSIQNIAFVGVITAEAINPGTLHIPRPYLSEFFSPATTPSLTQNKISRIITTQKTGDTYNQADTTHPEYTNPDAYMPYVFAGSSDALINFDPAFSRFTISQLHTSVRSGNGPYQDSDTPSNTESLNEVMTVSEMEAYICGWSETNVSIRYTFMSISPSFGNTVMSSQSGIALINMLGFLNSGVSLSSSETFILSPSNILLYKNTLFDKMGFDFEQMFPLFGEEQNEFNRGNHNAYLGYNVDAKTKITQMVLPFTTNAYVSSSIMIALSKNTNGPQATPDNPSGDLGATIYQKQAETNASSDLLIATNQPVKLQYPQLTVYSDIVRNSRYYGSGNGRQPLQAIAYVTRNYTSGDYFFGFATSWSYTADMNYVITDILTDIRLPNGGPAPLDPNSSIIYTITKPKYLPIPPPIQQHRKKEEEK